MSARALARVLEWVRHDISSLIATGVDFAVMIMAVELLHFSPVAGTVIGAASGGVTGFMLGRHFTFRANHVNASRQAMRYALVSAASLVLNAFGEHLFVTFLSHRYVLGRILIATTINTLWNYPMQSFFVFAEREHTKQNRA